MELAKPLLEVGCGVKSLQVQHIKPQVEGMGQDPTLRYLGPFVPVSSTNLSPSNAGGEGLPKEDCVLTLSCCCESPFCYLSSFPFALRKEFMGTHGLQQQASGREVIQGLEGCSLAFFFINQSKLISVCLCRGSDANTRRE